MAKLDKVVDILKAWTKADKEAQIEGVKRLGLPTNNTAADRAKVQVQSLLKRRGIDLIDGYELDLDLDLSYLL